MLQVSNYPVVSTIPNPDGTVSIIHVDPNNPVITLPDGTTAQVQLPQDGGSVHTLAEVATSENQVMTATHELQTNEHGHILITGDDGQGIPVQVSGNQFVTVPVNSSMYQTVVANVGEAGPHQLQVLNAPVQISGLQHLVMKTEPGEGVGAGAGQGLTITPVSGAGGLAGQQFSVLQVGEGGQQIITIRQRSPDQRDSQDHT